jgi:gamma-glutamyltranspeptidase / glutathione hydrolase
VNAGPSRAAARDLRGGTIVAAEPLAVEAGARVLRDGGNAFDAAVTCAFVQAVVNPQNCGVAGYLSACVDVAESRHSTPGPILVDAPALGGARVEPQMWEKLIIGANPDGRGYFLHGKPNDLGYQSICTPGTIMGLASLLERWGTMAWADAIAPAAQIAEQGFIVDDVLARGWQRKAAFPESSSFADYIRANAEASRIYLVDGRRPYEAGERLRNPDHARTLARLAKQGAPDFYVGGLADEIARDLSVNGSFVTAEDLADYSLRRSTPLLGTYGGFVIGTAPAPHGGLPLIQMLNILETYDLPRLGHNTPEYIYVLAMALKAAMADRDAFVGDPEHVDVPVERLISGERANYWRDRIERGEPIAVPQGPQGGNETTHVSVVDASGNCVALTHTLSSSSGVVTPGLGFIYNNGMFNFDPRANHPNSIAPGKGRVTGMTPTIVYRDGEPVLVIGGLGGSQIMSNVAQVIVNVVSFGMSLTDAVLAPRIDCQHGPIYCDQRIPEYVCADVRRRHAIERRPISHGAFAQVYALERDPIGGRVTGAADAGAGGMALGV